MLEELAIGVLGYVVLDKLCKDGEKLSREIQKSREQREREEWREKAKLAVQRSNQQRLNMR